MFPELGHAGIVSPDPAALASFYADVLGLQPVGASGPDAPIGASAFLSRDVDVERHDIAIFTRPALRHLAFKVPTLGALRTWCATIQDKGVSLTFSFNHGDSLAIYITDPDGNLLEVYWPTGLICSQFPPIAQPIDLAAPGDQLLRKVSRAVGEARSLPGTDWPRQGSTRSSLRVGHAGLYSPDPAATATFYRDVLGMHVVHETGPDGPNGASILLSGLPSQEHHQVALFARPELQHTAFKVDTLAELRTWHRGIREHGVPILASYSAGVSLAFFFADPAGNTIEIYWPTGLTRLRPNVEVIDLEVPEDVLLLDLAAWRRDEEQIVHEVRSDPITAHDVRSS